MQEQRNRGQGRDGRDDDRYEARHPAQQQVQAPAYGATPGQQPQVAGGEDPYAAYGGYNNYVAMWYAAMAQNNSNSSKAVRVKLIPQAVDRHDLTVTCIVTMGL